MKMDNQSSSLRPPPEVYLADQPDSVDTDWEHGACDMEGLDSEDGEDEAMVVAGVIDASCTLRTDEGSIMIVHSLTILPAPLYCHGTMNDMCTKFARATVTSWWRKKMSAGSSGSQKLRVMSRVAFARDILNDIVSQDAEN
jgi:hypothetical protein